MKKRALHGLGLALTLFSPLWITTDPPKYLTFGVSLVLGVLLLVLSSMTDSTA